MIFVGYMRFLKLTQQFSFFVENDLCTGLDFLQKFIQGCVLNFYEIQQSNEVCDGSE